MPVSRLAQTIDQDEEIATLIRMFAIGRKERKTSDSAQFFKAVQSLEHRNTDGLARPLGTNPSTLPPPSPFVRREKSLHSVPMGPSFIQVEVEPKAYKHPSSPHVPVTVPLNDKYSFVFEFLMIEPVGELSE